MVSIDGVQVGEAAEHLGLSEQRVRALLANGALDGRKIAGRWFVFQESIERLRPRRDVRGRRLSPGNAWAFLFAASGEEPDWLNPWDRSRLDDRLASDWERWIPRLGDRAQVRRYRAHPGSLKKLRSDRRLLLSGVSAASEHAVDLVRREEVEAYVRKQDFGELIQDYKLEESPRPNVVFHVVMGDWPFRRDRHVAPSAAVAIDLIESENSRSRRAGNSLLKRLKRSVPR